MIIKLLTIEKAGKYGITPDVNNYSTY